MDVAGILSVELLHVVAYGGLHFTVVEIDEVRIPLCVSLFGEERRVGRHGDDVTVALDGCQVEGLGQCRFDVIGPSRQVCGIFAQVDFRFLPVIAVVKVLVMYKPSGRVVVMLIHDGHFQSVGQRPSFFVVRAFVERASRADDRDVGMMFADGFVDEGKAFLKCVSDEVFIANADVFEVERGRMSCFGTHPCPFVGLRVGVGIVYQVQYVLDVFIHLVHRDTPLLASAQQLSRSG